MATITTSTANTSFSQAYGYPPGSMMDLNVKTGELWMVLRNTGTTIAVYKSTDKGVSWTSQGSLTRANLQDVCEMRIDQAGENIHLIYFVNESSQDKMYYRRLPITSGAPDFSTGEFLFSIGGTATPQAFLYSAALIPYKNPDGTFAIVIANSSHGTSTGITLYGISIKNDSGQTTYTNNGFLVSTRSYKVSGDDSSCVVTMDLEHNGDGITSAKPNIWVAWQVFSTSYCIKLSWLGYKSGWSTPASATTAAVGRTTSRDLPARWDGKRFIVLSTNPSDTTKLDVFERNSSNTGYTKRTSPAHPVGAIGANMISHNHVTQDFRLFAASTTGVVYWVDYIRATNTWGTWSTVSATAAVTSEWGVRRGTAGSYQYDVYLLTGTATPWTAQNVVLAVNFAPTAPTWITGQAGTVTANGAAFDASLSLTLDWNYNDPNTSDAQAQYALQRQIGTGTVQWWRTSDSTWQTVETFNASATSAVTLTTAQWLGAGGAADPAHVYKVATKDSGGLTSAYSAGLSVLPSTRVDPTLTAPAAGAVLNTGLLSVTWTNTEQSAYRVVVTNTATGAVAYDSGYLNDPGATPTVLSYTVPVLLPNGFAGSVALTTKNAEGLASTTRTAAFSIAFVEPVAPIVTVLAADPAGGGIDVAVTAGAATGTQPVTTQTDIWRRKATYITPVNSNPYFESNINDWGFTGYTSVVRSTTFAHTGVASMFLTPNGTTAIPYAQTVTIAALGGVQTWEARAWIRSTTANKPLRIKLQWYDSTPALISETTRDMTPVAGVWVWAWVQGTAPANATGVRIAVGQTGTPAATDTLYVDEVVLIQANLDQGIRVVAAAVNAQTYLDWRAVTGVNYEYRGYAEAANGTLVWSQWQA